VNARAQESCKDMFADGLIASVNLPCLSSPEDITSDRAHGLSDHELLPDALSLQNHTTPTTT
jgi:hypothetical protein